MAWFAEVAHSPLRVIPSLPECTHPNEMLHTVEGGMARIEPSGAPASSPEAANIEKEFYKCLDRV
ncbi:MULTISPECIES: hypothetical protein [unclassified Prochlorococcus]|uniref:hypothetical protein n=1 Tax=unclassified Prochlorococcus TaxID=2627481 RepID=UPI0005338C5F|nr:MULTISPECIES: hypothetical protein [unclassified Prochlorococcus]KGG23265.1 hypothetical protein EV12_3098 [Prochlorococcus sp. MIT 0701]KGG25613.1 hypothetical protein EV13_3112 [Prochlorococcus sp. MIT 0702]KGG30442.1 hypothetical protein EV14_3063 [Prochlorococcus sp. MIT 0703]